MRENSGSYEFCSDSAHPLWRGADHSGLLGHEGDFLTPGRFQGIWRELVAPCRSPTNAHRASELEAEQPPPFVQPLHPCRDPRTGLAYALRSHLNSLPSWETHLKLRTNSCGALALPQSLRLMKDVWDIHILQGPCGFPPVNQEEGD